MSIAKYLAKLAQSVTAQGVLSSTAVQGGGGGSTPTITAIGYPGDDTAVGLAGGDTITLTGTNFNTGVNVIINGTPASVVSRVNSTQLTFTTTAQATGSYIIYVVNTDGSTALAVPGLQYSPVPSWNTAAGSLGVVGKQTSFTTTLTATGDAPITYSVLSGTLPSGITINSSTGVLSGTTPDVSVSTTYNFTIRSTDAQLQDTDRAFSLTIMPAIMVEYLIVAGGGGGAGMYQTGGGGGGGVLTAASYPVTIGSPITVTVGAGGTAGPQLGSGGPGGNSVFDTITAYGGGFGGQSDGGNGGSGGGPSAYSANFGKGVYPGSTYISAARQGYDGNVGYSVSGAAARGGPGGGAGGQGQPGNVVTNQGGIGILSSISGTSTGYAGGGGGGSYGILPGDAYTGYGGGGGGGYQGGGRTEAQSGTANTGGGGGGTERGSTGSGGTGGSGVVIVRYADTYSAATNTTGSPTVTVAGGYRVYKFTSSGSITF